jgi:hypothetical protein
LRSNASVWRLNASSRERHGNRTVPMV